MKIKYCLIFSLLTLAGCSQPDASTDVQPETAVQASNDNLISVDPSVFSSGRVQIGISEISTIPRVLAVAGRIGINENLTVRIGTVTDGRITRIAANVGDRVTECTVLAELRSNEVDTSRAEYAKAVAELGACMSEVEFRKKLKERAARLYDLKAGSLDQLLRAEADLSRAESDVKVAQAEVSRLKEKLEHLGLGTEGALDEYTHPEGVVQEEYEDLEIIPILSPIVGTVLERLITTGSVVTRSDDLFVVSDLKKLWIHAEVPEEYLATLAIGQKASVQVEAFPDHVFEAVLAQIGDVLNPATRTVRVRCEANNQKGLLRPEMYAAIEFTLGRSEPGVVIPQKAVQNLEGNSVVFVKTSDSSFEVRKVTTGESYQGRIHVLDGIQTGEELATEGSFLLKSEFMKQQFAEE